MGTPWCDKDEFSWRWVTTLRGIEGFDRYFVSLLQRSGRPVLLGANCSRQLPLSVRLGWAPETRQSSTFRTASDQNLCRGHDLNFASLIGIKTLFCFLRPDPV